MNVQSDWWDHFFEGVSVDLWLRALAPEESKREADVLESGLAVPPGAQLLDVPSGGGRLSLTLRGAIA
ncbi:MAG TPA: hypothetical protein VFO14_24305 [Vicinamibacterales bacterium]|nr:hypothetical protein [Vicinamibacterales bacterium]